MTPFDAPFSKMNYDFEFIENGKLDLIFVTSYGEKTISPFVEYFIELNFESYEYIFSDEAKQLLSDTILAYFKTKWDKLKEIMKIEYDPIHNFSDEVSESIIDKTIKQVDTTDKITDSGESTKIRTDNLGELETRNFSDTETDDTTQQMQGFNSTSFKNKDKETTATNRTNTGTIKHDNTGTQENAETRNFQTNKTGQELTEDQYTRERNYSRLGNIGNITTQKMLIEEIELWKWSFIQQVLDDVKELITLSVYSS